MAHLNISPLAHYVIRDARAALARAEADHAASVAALADCCHVSAVVAYIASLAANVTAARVALTEKLRVDLQRQRNAAAYKALRAAAPYAVEHRYTDDNGPTMHVTCNATGQQWSHTGYGSDIPKHVLQAMAAHDATLAQYYSSAY